MKNKSKLDINDVLYHSFTKNKIRKCIQPTYKISNQYTWCNMECCDKI